jgi:hypothetical protein
MPHTRGRSLQKEAFRAPKVKLSAHVGFLEAMGKLVEVRM